MSSTTQPSKPVAPPPPPPPPASLQSTSHSSSTSVPVLSPPAPNSLSGGKTLEQTDFKNNNVTIFSWTGDYPETIEFDFPRLEEKKGSVSLRTVITQYVGALQSRKVAANKLFLVLGRFRCLRHAIEHYNSGMLSHTDEFLQYWRRHTLSL